MQRASDYLLDLTLQEVYADRLLIVPRVCTFAESLNHRRLPHSAVTHYHHLSKKNRYYFFICGRYFERKKNANKIVARIILNLNKSSCNFNDFICPWMNRYRLKETDIQLRVQISRI